MPSRGRYLHFSRYDESGSEVYAEDDDDDEEDSEVEEEAVRKCGLCAMFWFHLFVVRWILPACFSS